MKVHVRFYSYCKDLTGTAALEVDVPRGSSLEWLQEQLWARFPKLGVMRKSMLVAVDVEYREGNYRLQEGDEVSLFPPVQGG